MSSRIFQDRSKLSRIFQNRWRFSWIIRDSSEVLTEFSGSFRIVQDRSWFSRIIQDSLELLKDSPGSCRINWRGHSDEKLNAISDVVDGNDVVDVADAVVPLDVAGVHLAAIKTEATAGASTTRPPSPTRWTSSFIFLKHINFDEIIYLALTLDIIRFKALNFLDSRWTHCWVLLQILLQMLLPVLLLTVVASTTSASHVMEARQSSDGCGPNPLVAVMSYAREFGSFISHFFRFSEELYQFQPLIAI